MTVLHIPQPAQSSASTLLAGTALGKTVPQLIADQYVDPLLDVWSDF